MCTRTEILPGTLQEITLRTSCPCSCPLGWIRSGCDHLTYYPESAQGITQVTPPEEEQK